MQMVCPDTPERLAEVLRACAEDRRPIRLGGNFSKDRLGGVPRPADVTVSTHAMNRLLQYDPRDLTISVQAGMTWANLARTLAGNRQMLPLDPGWADASTVGGVVAANLSGPRRRLYGTARDMIIGMTFATLEGKLVNSGGMVVKNVAGLDMAKLMIGSFGTLAGIAVINFKIFPVPAESRTFVMRFESAADAFAERDRILRGPLQPAAIDLVNWPSGFRLLLRAAGNRQVVNRFERELPLATQEDDDDIWHEIRDFTPRFLAQHPGGAVIPIVCKLTEMPSLVEKLGMPFIARAGSGVIYAHCAEGAPLPKIASGATMMTKIKEMFDPNHLLNPGRLYGYL